MKNYLIPIFIAILFISVKSNAQAHPYLIYARHHKAPKPVMINPRFIYQYEAKEDGSYELIAYPKTTWIITKK